MGIFPLDKLGRSGGVGRAIGSGPSRSWASELDATLGALVP